MKRWGMTVKPERNPAGRLRRDSRMLTDGGLALAATALLPHPGGVA